MGTCRRKSAWNSTVTAGIVSAKGRGIGILSSQGKAANPIESFIQTDAAINPGTQEELW
jgi:S1-C subfamily serine protease